MMTSILWLASQGQKIQRVSYNVYTGKGTVSGNEAKQMEVVEIAAVASNPFSIKINKYIYVYVYMFQLHKAEYPASQKAK